MVAAVRRRFGAFHPHTEWVSVADQHNDLFVAADSAGRAGDWAGLWALRERLRSTDLWVGFYGATCAVAGWHVDRDAGWALLDEVIAAGFHQPELLAKEFADSFAAEQGWAERLLRMYAKVPAPSVELLDWRRVQPVRAAPSAPTTSWASRRSSSTTSAFGPAKGWKDTTR